jgi:hypothetical protein
MKDPMVLHRIDGDETKSMQALALEAIREHFYIMIPLQRSGGVEQPQRSSSREEMCNHGVRDSVSDSVPGMPPGYPGVHDRSRRLREWFRGVRTLRQHDPE